VVAAGNKASKTMFFNKFKAFIFIGDFKDVWQIHVCPDAVHGLISYLSIH